MSAVFKGSADATLSPSRVRYAYVALCTFCRRSAALVGLAGAAAVAAAQRGRRTR